MEFDEGGSIGRRYARFDEVGTPLCVTVDYETFEDGTVTVRNRASWKQVRAKVDSLHGLLREFFCGKIDFKNLGSPVKG